MADKKSNLSEQEKEEMKALQEMRKGAGNGGTTFTDSQRIRLSELQNKEQGGAAETGATTKKDETAAAAGTGTGALGKK